MEPPELLERMAEVLERLEIPYAVVGSMASIAHGEPRLTNDIDLLVDLRPEKVDSLCAAFPEPEYYCDRASALDAVKKHFQFNILHPESGLKVDMIIAGDSEFERLQFFRAAPLPDRSYAGWFASPEDVIIKKLAYYREGGSDKHIRDIAGVLKIKGEAIDREYIERWVRTFGLKAQWQLALQRSKQQPPS